MTAFRHQRLGNAPTNVIIHQEDISKVQQLKFRQLSQPHAEYTTTNCKVSTFYTIYAHRVWQYQLR